MPDISDLLNRTAPQDLPMPDLGHVAKVARRRQRRHRAAALSVVAVVGISTGAFALSSRDADAPHDTTVADSVDLGEPVGTWHEGARIPVGERGRMFGGSLSDGRVLAWGGGSGNEGGMTEFDGAIYDPSTDSWTEVPAAPLPHGTTAQWMQLSRDRLAVIGVDNDGRMHGAVLDTATRAWTQLPEQRTLAVAIDGMAFDGEHLALIRTRPGARGYLESAIDWSVPEPVTLRWTHGEDSWATGAQPPVSLRFGSGGAFDGSRFALVGGTTSVVEDRSDPQPSGPDRGVVGDGAIYDLAADRWTTIPATAASTAIHPIVSWLQDGRLIVGGGNDRLSDPGPDYHAVAAFRPADRTWSDLDTPDRPGIGSNAPWGAYDAGIPPVLLAATDEPQSGPHPRLTLSPDGWEEAPLNTIRTLSNRLIAMSSTFDNPGDGPFELFVRATGGTWLSSAVAPFTNRMDALTVVAGDKLVVIGGYQGPHLEPASSTWVFTIDPQ